ncbi:SCO7613 C-terminal domain-containing membrane protein [Microbacterium sp. B2969]|uniref:SCO7613 C-terminal domain-containing membrane protein n=1 Tax=Microbacterium alkaliflavum TaxID=3248839 RepID=A0ABW7QD18_9MICO
MTITQDGVPLWPASPFELSDAKLCPGCFTPITAIVCPTCGFGLTDPRAVRVLALGQQIVRLELDRRELIGEIRESVRVAARIEVARAVAAQKAAAAEAAEAAKAIAAAADRAAAVAAADPVEAPAHAGIATAPSARAATAPPASSPPQVRHAAPEKPRRRLTVPVLLLIVGVSLVGVAAIFFLVFAWFVWGIAVRALIIGGITLASIITASLLRRRSLTATAEGIGALGVVLLGLDAWAVRANDFFGTGASDAAIYAGTSALIVGFACRIWARFSGLRGPDLAAALAFPVGIGLLVGGTLSFDRSETFIAALLAASAGCLTHALPAPWSSSRSGRDAVPERITLVVIGIGSLGAAVLTILLAATEVSTIMWSAALVFVVGIAHAWALRPRTGLESLPAARGLAGAAASIAVATLALAGWLLALRSTEVVYPVLVAPVLATVVAVGVDVLHARGRTGRAPWVTASVAGALGLAGGAIAWGATAVTAFVAPWSLARGDVFAPASWVESPFLALPAAAVIAAVLFLAPSLARPGLADLRVLVAGILVLIAAAYVGAPGILVAVAVVIAAVATLFLLVVRERRGWVAVALVAAATAYLAGLAAPWLWLVGVATAIAVLVAQRVLIRPTGDLAVPTALAPVLVAALSTFIAPWALMAAMSVATSADGAAWRVSIALLQWVAVVTLAVAAALPLDRPSRSALAGTASILVGLSLVWLASGVAGGAFDGGGPLAPAVGEPGLAVARSGLLVVLFAVVALGLTRIDGRASIGAAALVAPTLAFAVYSVLEAAGTSTAEWMPLPLLGGAVVVVALGAGLEIIRPDMNSRWVRLAGDVGAAATAVVVVWPLPSSLVWAACALGAAGFAGLSVTHGWAAPAGAPEDDVFATRIPGVGVNAAPRRPFAWPAAVAAIATWWWWLGDGTPGIDYTTESAAVPAGAALVVFAASLVWLRRRGEAALALGAGLAIGLWAPAVEGWDGTPLRGTIVGVVSTLVCLVLSVPMISRVRPTAPIGAASALIGLGLVVVQRVIDGEPWQSAWLVLFVGVALMSALGHASATPGRLASRLYAEVAPGAAILAAAIAVVFSLQTLAVVTTAIGVLAALHVGAAAADRPPLTAVTRWTSLAGAALVGGSAMLTGVLTEIEAATLPVAAACLAGAVLAILRRRAADTAWPGGESIVWIAGLGVATVPSILAPADPPRVWTFIVLALLAAVAGAWARIPASWRVGVPTVLVTGLAAVLMGARALLDPFLGSADAAAITAGAGAVAVAVILVLRSDDDAPAWPSTLIAAAGAALIIGVVILRSDGELGTTAVTVLLGGVVGVGGAALLALHRWRGVGAVLAIGGLAVVAAGCAIRFFAVATDSGFEADFWALAGGAVAVAIVVAALRAVATMRLGLIGGAVLGAAAVAYAVAVAQLLMLHDEVRDGRTLLAMSVLALAGLAGALWHARIGWTLTIAAGLSAALLGVFAVIGLGVSPVELVTVPPALAGLAYGSIRLARVPTSRSWATLGPWLGLLMLPSLVHDLDDSELWRVVALGVVALALVVVGAVRRLQAPLILGSVVLILHAVAQLWPWITSAYTAVPWWLWLGIGGALLIFLAATYERRVRQLKAAFVTVSSLR